MALAVLLSACGGGGGGGGSGGSGSSGGGSNAPLITATVAAFTPGQVPAGFLVGGQDAGLVVQVLTQAGGTPVTSALVTVNGTSAPYDAASQAYSASINLNAGDTVAVTVQVAGVRYAASTRMFTVYPAITGPVANASVYNGASTTVSWNAAAASATSQYALGVYDASGNPVWPSATTGIQAAGNLATSYLIPANALSVGSRILVVGILDQVVFPGAAPGSQLITSGFASAPITVTSTPPASLASLLVNAPSAPLLPGGTQQLTVTGVYSDNTRTDLTSVVNWSSSDPTKVTVSSTGLLTGVAYGSATITVGDGALTGTSRAVVFQPGTSAALPLGQAVAYQADWQHTGRVTFGANGPTLPAGAAPTWSRTLPGLVSYPLIAGGRVYVTATGSGGGASAGSDVYALAEADGSIAWGPVHFTGTGWSAAAYDGGRLFVLDYAGQLSSLDAASGAQVWTIQLPTLDHYASAPVAVNGVVWLAGEGAVFAVDESNGNVLWTSGAGAGFFATPAVGPDGVYFTPSCPGAGKYTPYSGNPLWQVNNSCVGGGGHTPALFNGRLWVMGTGQTPPSVILDSATGSQLGSFVSAYMPAFSASSVYYDATGTLTAADLASGQAQWTFSGSGSDGGLVSSPLVIDSVVVVVSADGVVYARDATTGAALWAGQASGGQVLQPDVLQDVGDPPPGISAGEGYLVVPATATVNAWRLIP